MNTSASNGLTTPAQLGQLGKVAGASSDILAHMPRSVIQDILSDRCRAARIGDVIAREIRSIVEEYLSMMDHAIEFADGETRWYRLLPIRKSAEEGNPVLIFQGHEFILDQWFGKRIADGPDGMAIAPHENYRFYNNETRWVIADPNQLRKFFAALDDEVLWFLGRIIGLEYSEGRTFVAMTAGGSKFHGPFESVLKENFLEPDEPLGMLLVFSSH